MNKKDTDVLGGVEVKPTITNKNYWQRTDDLNDVLAYLLTTYPKSKAKDKLISLDDAVDFLSKKNNDGTYTNDAYRWIVIREKDKTAFEGEVKGKIVGVVAYDVWDVPENDGLHFTPLYYLAADRGYESAVNHIINTRVLPFAKKYSKDRGKRNIGFYTDETSSKKLLKGIIKQVGRGGCLGRMGVPTLEDISEEDYRKVNFERKSDVDLVFIPFYNEELTTAVAKEMVFSYLDQGYNGKQTGDEGYMPLSEMLSYKKFARNLDKEFPDGIVKLKPIR
ncbi:MAG: hypothetical protein Q7J54_07755 [Candidatus Woesearchaeota archaeon]|nr:hypothetical protein [Candidatus Woesearchaeota archaeon]